jgi:magnesium transporter
MNQGRVYRNGVLTTQSVAVADIEVLNSDTDAVYWIDLVSPSAEDLARVGGMIGLNATHIDDAFRGRQRPKLDLSETYLYINAYTTSLDKLTKELETEELAIFVTHNGMITVRDNDNFELSPILQHWDSAAAPGRHGVDYLIWGLLDVIVDGYFDSLETLDDEIEELEDQLFASVKQDLALQKLTYDLRKALVILRRLTLPMREIVGPLMRQEVVPISAEMAIHFHDVYDHVMRVADWTESLRDLITTLLETNLTIQGNYMNSIMKKVTSWAAIIAVPTAITGFYGQNVPYPGYMEPWGFWASIGVTLLVSFGLYLTFKARDWL